MITLGGGSSYDPNKPLAWGSGSSISVPKDYGINKNALPSIQNGAVQRPGGVVAGASTGPKPKAKSSSNSSSSKNSSKSSGPTDAEKAYEKMMKIREDQANSMEKAFGELLNSLGGEYEGYRTKYKGELDANQQRETQGMMARQMAYGTADSEQRDQANSQISSNYAGKYGSYLSDLAGQETNARKTIGVSRANAINSIMEGKASDAYNMMLNSQQQRQQEFQNSLASMKANGGASSKNKAQQMAAAFGQNWTSGQDNPFSRTGGREAGQDYLAAMLGGNAQDYSYLFPDGWENAYWQQPGNQNLPWGNSLVNSVTGQPIGGGMAGMAGAGSGQVMVDENGRAYIDQQ